MPTLLEIRERLREFYAKYTIYIVSVLKFIAALVVLLLLNAQIGSMEQLMSPLIVIIAALFCSFMPINTTVLVAAVLIGMKEQKSAAIITINGLINCSILPICEFNKNKTTSAAINFNTDTIYIVYFE